MDRLGWKLRVFVVFLAWIARAPARISRNVDSRRLIYKLLGGKDAGNASVVMSYPVTRVR